jgi:uncharacterized metal-binding protein YceD (DUF177 family)
MLIDLLKASREGLVVKDHFLLSRFPRFLSCLAEPTGTIEIELTFFVDQAQGVHADLELKASVFLMCEACNEKMPYGIQEQVSFQWANTEKEAATLPLHVQPMSTDEAGQLDVDEEVHPNTYKPFTNLEKLVQLKEKRSGGPAK